MPNVSAIAMLLALLLTPAGALAQSQKSNEKPEQSQAPEDEFANLTLDELLDA